MKVSRGVKKSVKVGVEKMAVDRCRCQACVEEQTTISRTKARSINLAVEKLSRRQELSDRSTRCRGGVEIAIRKKAWKLDR